MSSPLRFGIIGCGRIAPRHAEEAVKHGQLAAVCDIVPERAEKLALDHGAKAYSDPGLFFEKEKDLDVVAVCTPNGLHAAHSVQALRNGAHVLCEKPMCLNSSEARYMMDAAAAAGRKLFVVKSTRYNPALEVLKEKIQAGALGEIYSFQLNCFWNRPPAYYLNNWKGTADLDGGTLFTQFSHYIDAMLWLFGPVKTLSGFRKNSAHQNLIAFEDNGVVSLEMENGLLGGLNWSVNAFQQNMEVSLTVLAEKAQVRIGGPYMNRIDTALPAELFPENLRSGSANDYGFYKGSMSNHDQVYANLIKALSDETHPFTRAAEGLQTVETIERIYNSVSLQ